MSQIDEQFQKAADNVNKLSGRPGDDELLAIYALYKQATVGDCNSPKPGMFALKEKAKHEAWTQKKGMSQDDAKKEYIAAVENLIGKYGIN